MRESARSDKRGPIHLKRPDLAFEAFEGSAVAGHLPAEEFERDEVEALQEMIIGDLIF